MFKVLKKKNNNHVTIEFFVFISAAEQEVKLAQKTLRSRDSADHQGMILLLLEKNELENI